MRTKSVIVGLVIGVGACILVGPALAEKLQWATWVTYIVIGLDGLLLADVPYQFSVYSADSRLRQRGYGEFADGQGSGCLSFLLFGIAPLVVLGWLVWQYLSIPVSSMPFEPSEPMVTEAFVDPAATEAPVELAPTEAPVATEAPIFSGMLSFVYPVDGQVLDYEGAYLFKITPVEGADGYLWGFFQNGVMVWENFRDEGELSGVEYGIYEESLAHSQFVPGYAEVWVRASIYGEWTEPTVITIYLEPR